MRKLSVIFVIAALAVAAFVSCNREDPEKEKSPYDKYAVDLGLSVKWASVNVGDVGRKGTG
jgi:hypothetical protein